MGRVVRVVVAGSVLSPLGLYAQSPKVPPTTLQPPSASVSEPFEHVSSVRELDDGRLIVAEDAAHFRLSVVDWRTGAAESIGREGAGPGEYRSIGRIVALPADSSLVTDPRNARWLVLDGARIVGSVRHGPGSLRNAQIPLGADARGRVLELEGFAFPTPPTHRVVPWYPNAESLLVLLTRRDSSAVDTVAHIRGRYRGTRQAISPKGERVGGMAIVWDLVNPLAAEDQALLFPDGWVAVAFGNPYRVDWITPEGNRIPGAPLPFTPQVLDDRERQHALAVYRPTYLRAGFTVADIPGWPRVLPPFPINALLAAPDGAVAIERTAESRFPGRYYDIVDRTGRLVRRLRLPPNERLAGFGRLAAFVIAQDSDDLEWLSRHPWP